MNRIFILLIIVFACGCKSTQGLLKDQRAVEMIAQGKTLLDGKQYAKAAQVFEEASARPFHQSTTYALYLSGLSYYYNGEGYAAAQQFERLERMYPKSRYVDDAEYHTALTLLEKFSEDQQVKGLNKLFSLSKNAKNKELRENALKAAEEFLFFKAKAVFIENYKSIAPTEARQTWMEAAAYRKAKENKKAEVQTLYDEYLKGGGPTSAFVAEILKEKKPAEILEPNIIKIGLFLPVYLDDVSLYDLREIPEKSETALNFYEGFDKAVRDYALLSKKKIFVKTFDSRRDTFRINFFLKELEQFQPDLVVGEVYTDASRAISHWSSQKKIPQIVPFSMNPVLIQDSSGYTFLARASARTHGKRMAEYAAIDLSLKNVVTWTDGTRFTEMINKTFAETFRMYGGDVTILRIDSVYEERAQEDITEHFKQHLKSWDGIDGVYIPIGNEESASLILTTMRVQGKPADGHALWAMGTPGWQNFTLLSQAEKEYFNLLFTDSYAEKNDPLSFSRYYNYYFKEFNMPPTKENIQGYGLGSYLAKMLDTYKPSDGSLADYIRSYPQVRTAHSDYFFKEMQDNQALHIFEFRDGGTVKINK